MLLVDSDECFRTGFAENLRDDGHQVCEYAAPAEVPALTVLGNVSAALMEYSPADSEQLELAKAIHEAFPSAAVLLVTACSTNVADLDAAAHPFLHVQSRPLDYSVLHDLVHRLCTARPK